VERRPITHADRADRAAAASEQLLGADVPDHERIAPHIECERCGDPADVWLVVSFACGEHAQTWAYCSGCAEGLEQLYEEDGLECPFVHPAPD
jgi:DNA-directed RNA polymerase subunit RPC12/RpoP